MAIYPKKINISLIISVFFMSWIIFSGIFIVSDVMGLTALELKLNPQNNGLGNIKCNSSDHVILVGNPVSCEVENNNLKYNEINLTFTYNSGNQSSVILNSTQKTFLAPKDLRYIYFDLIDEEYSSNISTASIHNFRTYEEYKKGVPVFLAAYLSLILLVFVTVPSSVLNIKKLIINGN